MTEPTTQLIERWQKLCQQIQAIAKEYPATEPRRLIAVSKYADILAMRALYQAGQIDFAENYWQAAQKKIHDLSDLTICWHFIGQLQSNKCSKIAKNFDWVHSVANKKHVLLLATARAGMPPLPICLQVNLTADPKAQGVLPKDLPALIEGVLAHEVLLLRGFMLVPKPGVIDEFKQLALLRDEMELRFNLCLPTLSMGMSNDYRQAIAAGATMLRIGSALFNPKLGSDTH